MADQVISRREFLKMSALSLGALGAARLPEMGRATPYDLPRRQVWGRVTRKGEYTHAEPDEQSAVAYPLHRDQLLDLIGEISSPYGPAHNPSWYRLAGGGFAHSAYIQRLGKIHLNPPIANLPERGVLGEITVPYTGSIYRSKRTGQFMPMYRLYYGSLHWITGLMESPQGEPWAVLTDEWLRVEYFISTEHIRPLAESEFAPIRPEVPPEDKHIEVDLAVQAMTAYEGNTPVYRTKISSGKKWMETPSGEFFINRKAPSKHMGSGALSSDLDAFELPGVPWVSFFHTNGVAFHGVFWHDDYGRPTSQGCVNVSTAAARWLFLWSAPTYIPFKNGRKRWSVSGQGTPITIF